MALTKVSSGLMKPDNNLELEYTSQLGTTSVVGAATGYVVRTNYYDANVTAGSGATFKFTGVTTLGKAGNVPNADGYFYDAVGRQFICTSLPKLTLHCGAAANGSTDDTSALTAWLALGGELFVPQGVHMTNGNHAVVSNTWIRGDGTLKRNTDTENRILNISNVDNVLLEGFKIDDNKAINTGATIPSSRKGVIGGNLIGDGNLSTNIKIIGVTILNPYLWGIRFFNLQDSIIKNCSVTGGAARGIGGGSNWANVDIEANLVSDCVESGISVNGKGNMSAPVGSSNHVRIINNSVDTINRNAAISFSGIGIELIGDCTESIIANNAVKDCDSMLISTGFTARISVTGNTCRNSLYNLAQTNQGWGIESSGVSDSIYSNNVISDVTIGYSIQSAQNILINGGTLIDAVRTTVSGTDTDTKAVFIKGNEPAETAALFGYDKATNNVRVSNLVTKGWHWGLLVGNKVEECEFSGWSCDSPYHGLDVGFGGLTTNPSEISILNNVVRDTYLRGCRFANTSHCKMIGNQFIGERGASTAIAASSATASVVKDNLVIGVTTPSSGFTFATFANLDTTPNVSNGGPFLVSNSVATSITTFDAGFIGQEIILFFADANTTLVDGATIQLSGGVNFISSSVDIVKLMYDGAKWVETSRSVN